MKKNIVIIILLFINVIFAQSEPQPEEFWQSVSVKLKLLSRVPKYPQVRPIPIEQTLPNFPYAMRAAGVSGEVTIRFVVNVKGGVEKCRVVESSLPEFGEVALAAVTAWRFRPGLDVDRTTPIDMELSYKIIFEKIDD